MSNETKLGESGQVKSKQLSLMRELCEMQNLTGPPECDPASFGVELTPKQEMAIHALLMGKSITETAAAIRAGRNTVSGWVNNHYGFRQTLERERLSLGVQVRDRLLGLSLKAVEVVETHLNKEDADPAIALSFLRMISTTSRDRVQEADEERLRALSRDYSRMDMAQFRLALKRHGVGPPS